LLNVATQRQICLKLRVTDAERELIATKMKAANIRNREAYLRKMALDGFVINLDFSDVRRMIFLLSNATNNLNQIARHLNSGGNSKDLDIRALQADYEKLWDTARDILKKLSKL